MTDIMTATAAAFRLAWQHNAQHSVKLCSSGRVVYRGTLGECVRFIDTLPDSCYIIDSHNTIIRIFLR